MGTDHPAHRQVLDTMRIGPGRSEKGHFAFSASRFTYWPDMSGTPKITDDNALRLHRLRPTDGPAPFLHQVAATDIKERLDEINKSFTAPLFIGHATSPLRTLFPDAPVTPDTARLSVEPVSHDLAIHAFGLHWADDPVGQMVQARLALKPDGLFLAVLFGGATLNELRSALAEAETHLTGGLSPRVLPMADIREMGSLLSRAGLALPVADSRRITVRYSSLTGLANDLRDMGETNALLARHRAIPPKRLFDTTEEIYHVHFSDDEGYLLATFEMVFLTGWAPSERQQKPLRPGSASHRLAKVLGTKEQSTGDPVAPRLR